MLAQVRIPVWMRGKTKLKTYATHGNIVPGWCEDVESQATADYAHTHSSLVVCFYSQRQNGVDSSLSVEMLGWVSVELDDRMSGRMDRTPQWWKTHKRHCSFFNLAFTKRTLEQMEKHTLRK